MDRNPIPDAGLNSRDDALGRLRPRLRDVAAGQGVVVTITGPVACGKTSLLDALTDLPGFLVLRALCSAEESVLPYGVLDQLTDHETVASRAPGFVPLPGARATDASSGVDAARLANQFTRAVLRLSAERPVMVVVDDVDRADPESLLSLRHLARRVGAARVALVFTELRQPLPPTSHSTFHADLLGLSYYEEIGLRPLSPGDVAEFVREQLGVADGEDQLGAAGGFAADFFGTTGGNLLLVRGLINDLRTTRTAADAQGWPIAGDVVVGAAFRHAYLGSLHRCGPAAVGVARAAAVLGDATDDRLVSRLSGVAAGQIGRVRCMMGESGLLRGLSFPHPEARSAVLDDLSPAERRRLHGLALDALVAQSAPADVLAVHQTRSRRNRGPGAAEVYAAAATLACRRGELDVAAERLEEAYVAAEDAESRAALRFRLAMSEWRRDPGLVARHVPELAAASAAGLLPPWHAVLLASWLLLAGRIREALPVLQRCRFPAQARVEVRTWTRALSVLYPELSIADQCDLADRDDRAERTGQADRAEQDGRADGSDGTALGELVALPVSAESWARVVTAYAHALRGRSARAVEEAEQVLRLIDSSHCPGGDAAIGVTALFSLVYAGDADCTQLWCEKLTATADAQGSASAEAALAAVRAELAVRRGDFPAAVEAGRAALSTLSLPSWGVVASLPLSCLVVAHTRIGRYDEAARYLEEAVPEATDRSVFGLHQLWARGQYHLATGHAHAAYTDLRICGERMQRWRMDVSDLLTWRVGVAETLLAQDGPCMEGRRLLREELDRAPTGRVRGLALLAMAGYSAIGRRVELLEQAVELLAGDRYARARAHADLGDTYTLLKQHVRARQAFGSARLLAQACGAVPLLNRLGAEAAEAAEADGSPAQRVAALTDAEARVASLAAAGCTNREIAMRLFVTASTVEQHLTKIFRKLGVRNRRDLPTDLAAGYQVTIRRAGL
ncbi:LuxR family transcriptional regulator [Streptomyces sp. NBC_00878]|uniref:LuxR family transcriptional regulator n=1 Tax=Streptomyces sp. NBC_00878 TaxID=2975854 RepID=UPI002252F97B|nr:LuxR family transcriptional regulator [Streptomyces sp. NBC_00878]MCX4911788.1 LuxR family transcriptional regulator [Streptomyces sp. NBC_00878]